MLKLRAPATGTLRYLFEDRDVAPPAAPPHPKAAQSSSSGSPGDSPSLLQQCLVVVLWGGDRGGDKPEPCWGAKLPDYFWSTGQDPQQPPPTGLRRDISALNQCLYSQQTQELEPRFDAPCWWCWVRSQAVPAHPSPPSPWLGQSWSCVFGRCWW